MTTLTNDKGIRLFKNPLFLACLHLGWWAFFISCEIYLARSIENPAGWIEYASYYAIGIALFYLLSHGILPYAHKHHYNWGWRILLACIALLIYSAIHLLVMWILMLMNIRKAGPINTLIWEMTLWRGFLFVVLGKVYWLMRHRIMLLKIAYEEELARLRVEKEKAELLNNLFQYENAYLQAQVKPHMLFNTLNFVYSNIESVSPEAAESISLLSSLMRHAMQPIGTDGKVNIIAEVEQVENLVRLNQLRFGVQFHLDVKISIHDKDRGLRIIPLVIITLVENIFKHGDLSKQDDPATLQIDCKNGMLHLITMNRKRNKVPVLSTSTGIKNLQTRLDNKYGRQAYHMAITEDEYRYIVDFKLSP